MKKSSLEILQSRNFEEMQTLAQDAGCEPEALFVLSQSLSPEIRGHVAENQTTPHQADELLVDDGDVSVRCSLARKVANRVAGAPDKHSQKLKLAATEILTRMIADQEVHVRRVISEEIKASQWVPKDIVTVLANDTDPDVCCPVLEYSPLLEDDDLIDIISRHVHSPALESVAKRKQVSANVADQLITGMDANAVAALLRNPNAQIREDALDLIIDAADNVDIWHAPLASRSSLSFRAIKRICNFVAESLMNDLMARADIDEDTRNHIAERVKTRSIEDNMTSGDEDAVIAAIRDQLLASKKAGTLDAEYLSGAAGDEKHMHVRVGLGLLADIDHTLVHHIFSSRSAKAITALCWKAGMPMWLARKLQELSGKIDVENCLDPNDDGDFPMKESELEWHFALFTENEEDDVPEDSSLEPQPVTTSLVP